MKTHSLTPKWGIAIIILASLAFTPVRGEDKSHSSTSKWSNEASGDDFLNSHAFSLSNYNDAEKSWHDDSKMDFSFGGASESSCKLTSSDSKESDHKSNFSVNDWGSHSVSTSDGPSWSRDSKTGDSWNSKESDGNGQSVSSTWGQSSDWNSGSSHSSGADPWTYDGGSCGHSNSCSPCTPHEPPMNCPVAPVPEPGSATLLASIAVVGLLKRRRPGSLG